MNKGISLQEFKKQLLEDKGFRKEYERKNPELEMASTLMSARLSKGVSQEKLARRMKTKQSSIARAENGRTLPSLSFLKRVADALEDELILPYFRSLVEREVDLVSKSDSGTFSFADKYGEAHMDVNS